MENGKPSRNPMSSTCVLESCEDGKNIEKTKYRGIINLLLYLIVSRPNILFSICKCVRFQSAPKKPHLTVVKRIIRYLISKGSYGLWYPKSTEIDINGFLDEDYEGDKVYQKSTSGTFQFMGKSLV